MNLCNLFLFLHDREINGNMMKLYPNYYLQLNRNITDIPE